MQKKKQKRKSPWSLNYYGFCTTSGYNFLYIQPSNFYLHKTVYSRFVLIIFHFKLHMALKRGWKDLLWCRQSETEKDYTLKDDFETVFKTEKFFLSLPGNKCYFNCFITQYLLACSLTILMGFSWILGLRQLFLALSLEPYKSRICIFSFSSWCNSGNTVFLEVVV